MRPKEETGRGGLREGGRAARGLLQGRGEGDGGADRVL